MKANDKRIGNNFWELRSKHGRDKLFKTPELLWEAACEYFVWVSENPFIKVDWVGAQAIEVRREIPKPYTLEGLCIYLDCSSSYFRAFKSTATEKEKEFLTVIARIENIIHSQQFDGASSGLFNANIIARSLGLVDKVNNDVTGTMRNINITPASEK